MPDDLPMGQAPVIKNMIELPSGNLAEAIYYSRSTKQVICLSTQLSCAVGCVFCASPDGNKTVNLTTNDMIAQVDHMEQYANDKQVMLYSFMGEGEPLQNLSNVAGAILELADRTDLPMRVAVSTSGIKPDAIKKFAGFVAENSDIDIKLQLSLHAPTDAGRRKIIPVSKPITDIMDAMDYYSNTTHGPIDINYTLLDGINDAKNDALLLADLCKNYHVKVSKYNKVHWANFSESTNRKEFVKTLMDRGISVEYHLTDGESVYAACGQTKGYH